MPMPGGPQGGGGPQPMPKPPGAGGGGPDPMAMAAWGRQQQQSAGPQQAVDEANMALRQAQISGANPMMLAQLEQAAMQAQRGMEQWQQQQYATQMGQLSQRGPGDIGGGRGQSQLEQNPYLQMLMQANLGMGGGRGGGGGPNNMGGGY